MTRKGGNSFVLPYAANETVYFHDTIPERFEFKIKKNMFSSLQKMRWNPIQFIEFSLQVEVSMIEFEKN